MYVVSLLTRVPVGEALEVVAKWLEEDWHLHERTSVANDIVSSTELCLKSSYRKTSLNRPRGQPWALHYPLSLLTYNNMEHFEQVALDSAPLRPKLWLCYVDDTFDIWPQNQTSLAPFLEHLNIIREPIQFTME